MMFARNQRVFWWEGTDIPHKFRKHYGNFLRETHDRYVVLESGEHKEIHKDRVFSLKQDKIKENTVCDPDGSITRNTN